MRLHCSLRLHPLTTYCRKQQTPRSKQPTNQPTTVNGKCHPSSGQRFRYHDAINTHIPIPPTQLIQFVRSFVCSSYSIHRCDVLMMNEGNEVNLPRVYNLYSRLSIRDKVRYDPHSNPTHHPSIYIYTYINKSIQTQPHCTLQNTSNNNGKQHNQTNRGGPPRHRPLVPKDREQRHRRAQSHHQQPAHLGGGKAALAGGARAAPRRGRDGEFGAGGQEGFGECGEGVESVRTPRPCFTYLYLSFYLSFPSFVVWDGMGTHWEG